MCSTGIVKFYEKEHSYECDNEKYISVSTLIGKYEDKFDSEGMSAYKAIEFLYQRDYPKSLWEDKKQGMRRKFLINGSLQKEYTLNFFNKHPKKEELILIRDKFLRDWNKTKDIASEGGTKYHAEREAQTIFEKFGVTLEQHKANEEIKGYKESYRDIYNEVIDGDEPELLVYDHELRIAGQMDRPHFKTKGRMRYVKIYDYKTNFKGINRKNDFGKKFKYPLNHLDECKFNKYALQQSLYGYLLERKGFIYIGGVLEWRKIDFETGEQLDSEDIEVPYLRNEVIAMINHYQESVKEKRKSLWD